MPLCIVCRKKVNLSGPKKHGNGKVHTYNKHLLEHLHVSGTKYVHGKCRQVYEDMLSVAEVTKRLTEKPEKLTKKWVNLETLTSRTSSKDSLFGTSANVFFLDGPVVSVEFPKYKFDLKDHWFDSNIKVCKPESWSIVNSDITA